jgi:hypothetical protein
LSAPESPPRRVEIDQMDVLGVDLATEPAGTAACWLRSESGRTRLEVVTGRLDDDLLVDVLASADRAAIDSPFGWPEPFVAAITRWQHEGSFPSGPVGLFACAQPTCTSRSER